MAKLTDKDGGASIAVPPGFRDRVTMRMKEASFGSSKSSGNEQFTLVAEIILPESVSLDGKEYVLAGQEITYYAGISTVKSNPEAKTTPWSRTRELLKRLELPVELDTDEKETDAAGKQRLAYLKHFDNLVFDAILTSTERVAQRKEGSKYVPILDGKGQPIKQGWVFSNNLEDILGKSYVQVPSPY